ncbi:hypothetical protein DERP_000910 [Dermatophagoides pteronyssinus]|uniref:Galactose-1-phosphate uridylyltransferase n=1 Tax=Dermatophagoides pteronyssinus TaxID=6956 RepID=A0ABQ8JD03_DERPT|nr:hypothetical protein DERP_000910 [Dermatophagoides pteronyssinus]
MAKFGSIELDYPHNRYNPLLDEWILVCPHRSKRPWMGKIEKKEDHQNQSNETAAGEKLNALSPGGIRANGIQNPLYNSTYVFDNDFPALIDTECPDNLNIDNNNDDSQLFRVQPARGRCRVMCFHPSSRLSLPLMSIDEILAVINAWIGELLKLGPIYRWVQIFENKGAIMGCSNPHPHCQIWASHFLPNIPRKKDQQQRNYFEKYGRAMLWDYVQKELSNEERIVIRNEHWLALVPFWATWPFETMLLPYHRSIQRLNDINEMEKKSLASIMKGLLTIYDNLFEISFPYSMGWHGAPTGPEYFDSKQPHWILHAVYYPPLLRSATIKKFMVGYELCAQSQRDITPEKAAEILRQQNPNKHYKKYDSK